MVYLAAKQSSSEQPPPPPPQLELRVWCPGIAPRRTRLLRLRLRRFSGQRRARDNAAARAEPQCAHLGVCERAGELRAEFGSEGSYDVAKKVRVRDERDCGKLRRQRCDALEETHSTPLTRAPVWCVRARRV